MQFQKQACAIALMLLIVAILVTDSQAGYKNYDSDTMDTETTSTKEYNDETQIKCYRSAYNTTANGLILSKFNNVELSTCCELCHMIGDCVLAQYEYSVTDQHNYYHYQHYDQKKIPNYKTRCTLYKKLTSLYYSTSTSALISQFPTNTMPYKCDSRKNRLYYELTWTRIDDVTDAESCIEACTVLYNDCKSWAFDNVKQKCFTSLEPFVSTKSTNYTGITTGTCTYY